MKANNVIAFPPRKEVGQKAETAQPRRSSTAARDSSASRDKISRRPVKSESDASEEEKIFLYRFHQASNLRDWYLQVGDDEKWRRISDKMAEALRYGVSYVVIPAGLDRPAEATGLELLTVGAETFRRQVKEDYDATEA